MRFRSRKISVLILTILCALCLACGLSACKAKGPVENPYSSLSYKLQTPNDGSLPTDHTALDNLGYMAYVLENQPVFHSYARNSSVAMGFEQITQSWKDFKNQTEIGKSVMICSDLSYSSLVKSGTQSCFIGNSDAYMRTASKPGRDTVPATANWSSAEPTRYSHDGYLKVYGEFSTEMTVYIINADTIQSSSAVTVNPDGTYSLNVKLKPEAASYYQYGMATRGGLKGFPVFNRIEITFTFDKDWQVLKTYCEEDTEIAPKALGGMPTSSAGKTTTEFSYGEENFDSSHFSYFESYYKQYLGVIGDGDTTGGNSAPELLDVLGGGFSQVVNPDGNGQQFNVDLRVGKNEYTGKLYLKLASMDDILGTLDVRAEFSKRGSGRQDLYIDFKKSNVNVYYGENFALCANLDGFKTIINQVTAFLDKFSSQKVSLADIDTAEPQDGGLDMNELLKLIKFSYDDTSATVAVKSDNLLGSGVGVSAELNFGRTIDEDGSSIFKFSGASVESLKFGGESIDLLIAISPDASENIIYRKPNENPANLSDYAESVFGLLNGETIKFDISLNGESGGISYIKDVTATAQAYLKLGGDISAKTDIEVSYKNLSARLSAYYDVNINSGNFGTAYLHLTELCQNPVSAKLKCEISDTASAVERLISALGSANTSAVSEEEVNGVATIINKVLNLDFSKIIGGLYADSSKICVSVDIDEVLSAFSLNLGDISLGKAALTLNRLQDNCNLSLNLPAAGLEITATGSNESITVPDGASYVDGVELINLITSAIQEGKAIENAGALAFEVALDYGEITIAGLGEISWKNGVVLALEGTLCYGDSKMPVKLLYDGNSETSVKLQINGVGIAVTKTSADSYAAEVGNTAFGITQIVSVDDLVKYLFKVVNDITITLEDSTAEGVKNLVITYAAEDKVVIGVNGGFNLTAEIRGVSADISAKASDGEYINNFKVDTKYSSNNNEDIYNFALDLFETVELENILGGKNYAVAINLNGANGGIQILKDYGINASATLYYSEEYERNMLRADLNLSVEQFGVNAKVSLIYYGKVLYLEINELNGNALSVKAQASADEVYSAVEFIINYISSNGAKTASLLDEQATEQVSGIISNLLGFDIKQAISYDKANGLTVNADYLINNLGANLGFEIGTINATADFAARKISASARLENCEPWLTVNASPASMAPVKPAGDYIDLAQLVKLIQSAIEEGKAIENAGALAFEVALNYGEITVEGLGEVSWKNGVAFALDASLSYGNAVMPVLLSYDSNASEQVKLNINGVGISIFASQTEQFGEEGGNTAFDITQIVSVDDLVKYLFKVVNDITLTLEDSTAEGVKNLVITYAAEDKVVIGVNGGFNLTAEIRGVSADISAKASDGSYVNSFKVDTKYSSNSSEDIYNFALDLFETVELENILGGKNYAVAINLNGANSGIQVLKDYGVAADLTLYYSEEYENNMLRADMDLSVTPLINGTQYEISVKASLIYYGKVLYLEINELNGNALSVKAQASADEVYSAVEFIINYISSNGVKTASLLDEQATEQISGIISNLLGFDIKQAISYDKANGLTVNADYLINNLGANLGFEIGTINATADFAARKISASARLENCEPWLTVNASPASMAPAKPAGEYVDVFDLWQIISSAKAEAEEIIADKAVSFSLSNAEIDTDGVKFIVNGKGEADWSNKLYLALDLTFTVAEGDKADALCVKVIYDGNAKASNPLVRLCVNELAFEIYRSDLDKAEATINEIKNAINSLTGNSGQPARQTLSERDEGINVSDILSSENINLLIGKLLGFANKLNLSLGYDGQDVQSVIINYLNSGSLTLSSEGDLKAVLSFKTDGVKIGLTASVAALEKIGGVKSYPVKDEINAFIDTQSTLITGEYFLKSLYDYAFKVIENLSIKDVLGSDTYTVSLNLNGNDSNVAELAGVTVNGTLYYTEALEGDKVFNGKLAEADLDMVIGGFQVKLNARYNAQNIYVVLNRMGATELEGIKIRASVHDIYALAEKLVEIITNENVSGILGNLIGGNTQAIDEEQEKAKVTLTQIINGLLTLDFKKAVQISVETTPVSKVTTVTADIDYVLKTLGVDRTVGKAVATLDDTTHNLSVNMFNADGSSWANFKAVKTSRKTYPENWNAGYIDAEFAVKLVTDLYTTVTDENKNIYTLYTFTGDAKVLIDLTGFVNLGDLTRINIPLKILTITLGLDENGDFYFTLIADLDKTTAMGFTVTENRNVSITYSSGYLTLGRNVDRADREFKVMTMNYFLDNLFTNSADAPLPWLLGISASKNILLGNNSLWGLIADNVSKSVNIDSGLTKAGEYYLYEALSQPDKKSEFSLSDILNSFSVNVGGEFDYSYSANGQNAAAAEKLNLTSDYYAFDLNLKNLTNGAITETYAALLRDNEKGISGLKAYLNVMGMLKVDVTLDNYLKGVTAIYGQSKSKLTQLSAEEKAQLANGGVFTYTKYDGTDFIEGVDFFVSTQNGYEKVDTENYGFDKSQTYFVRENVTYYVQTPDGGFELAKEEYDENTVYYAYKADGVNDMAGSAAPNYFAEFKDVIDFNKYAGATEDSATHTTPIFGCYNSDGTYTPSNVLSEVTLNVIATDGVTSAVGNRVESLRYGVKVYLRNVFSPVWIGEDRKVVYSFSPDDLAATQTTVNGETFNIESLANGGYGIASLTQSVTVYAHAVNSVKVQFYIRHPDGSPVLKNALGEITVNGGFVEGDVLPEYPVEGYAFLGWFKDDKFQTPVTSFDGTQLNVYGVYVVDEETINGVTYSYDRASKVYKITGANAEKLAASGYTKPKAEGGKTLVLENELYGSPVTEIDANVFKSTGVKNAVVPENVTKVGAQAFMDNYGMESIAFIADSVYLGGNSVKGDNRYVFFGCSITNGSNDTKLHVYYNSITSENGGWDTVRDGVNIGRNMMGGKHESGWAFVHYATDGEEVSCLMDGLKTTAATDGEIRASVLNELNLRTSSKGYINAYETEVSGGYSLNGKINVISVNITKSERAHYYAVAQGGIAGSVFESENVVHFDGKIFIESGSDVVLNPPDGYEFVSVTSQVELVKDETGCYKFVMPSSPLTFDGETVKASVSKVTLNSAVDFVYGDRSYAAGQLVLENVTAGETQIYTPSAEGYYFLGWAYNNGGVLEFASSTVEYGTYYAVWAAAREEITSVGVLTSGGNPNADLSNVEVNASLTGGIYKWYKDPTFANEANSLTINDTVLYSRMSFNVTYSLSGSDAYYFINVANSDPKKDDATASGKTHSKTYTVLEGTSVSLQYTGDDGKKQLTVVMDGVSDTIRVKDKGMWPSYNAGKSQDLNFNTQGWIESNGVYSSTVSGNVNIQISH